MKNIIILTLLLVFATASFSQQIVQKKSLTQADYLQKSKKQKKAGSIFLVVGAGLIITAFIIPRGELVSGGIYCGPGAGILCNEEYENDGIKSAFFIAGGLSAFGSIPFFIASSKNKKKARAASAFINMEKVPVLQAATIRNQTFPALGLKISL
jgi:ABC-type Fe3+ transport system permease subunit